MVLTRVLQRPCGLNEFDKGMPRVTFHAVYALLRYAFVSLPELF